ncbi:sugar phosphate nucleotidyltransferase [Candidatus Pelagibacter ubique]|jgi:glucose-1-phosphate cytidylyltransferase|nr:sugar phosphate nucleotidyltransferase [Candidatus Pelagibacter ubique]
MKLVILAGGLGTRLSEETKVKPKPLIKIGNRPIIWHIMKIYSKFGINEFIICQGYKGDLIKKELSKYENKENWKIKYINTGLNTMTGGRIKRIKKYIGDDKIFSLSYGDGVSNVNIKKLIKFHIQNEKMATLTAVKQNNRFGVLVLNKNNVKKIKEKPTEFINGGFFILSNKIFKYLKNDKSVFERDCLPKLAKVNQLSAFIHKGFWGCMDTLRDKRLLNIEWRKKTCKWRVW